MSSDKETFLIFVSHCARCGSDHTIEFRAFSIHPMVVNGYVYPYWGRCEITGDPVLMRAVDTELIVPTDDSSDTVNSSENNS